MLVTVLYYLTFSVVQSNRIVLSQIICNLFILFLDTFKCLTPVNANEVLQFMFSEVNKTNSFLCFQQLHDMLEDNEVHIEPKRVF